MYYISNDLFCLLQMQIFFNFFFACTVELRFSSLVCTVLPHCIIYLVDVLETCTSKN